ncbi:hypothetical protein ACWGB8_30790 [Kitasatospora sp. NPDC054939]
MPLRAPAPLPALALGCALLLAAGCTTVAPSADRAAAGGRELTAAELRAAAVTDGGLGPGYTVTVLKPGHGETAGGGREVSDLPDCQPLLDAVTPGARPAVGGDRPYAETELSVARAADPRGSVYGGLLAYREGRAERLREELERLLGRCGSFTSTAPGPPEKGAAARRGVRARHHVVQHDTPTPGGADAALGFTLTNESGSVVLAQRVVLVRVGPVVAVFSTVGVGAEPAAVPDERIVGQQAAGLRAAQAGR